MLSLLLTHSSMTASDISATIITTKSHQTHSTNSDEASSDGIFIHRATFSHTDTADSLCDWQMILESMHIAFMQREALRFEADFFDEMELAAESAFVSEGAEPSDESADEEAEDASQADDSTESSRNLVTGLLKT